MEKAKAAVSKDEEKEMNRLKLLILALLFVLFSGCAHHIVDGVEVKIPEPDQDITKKSRF